LSLKSNFTNKGLQYSSGCSLLQQNNNLPSGQ